MGQAVTLFAPRRLSNGFPGGLAATGPLIYFSFRLARRMRVPKSNNPLVTLPPLANTRSMNLVDAKSTVVFALGRMNTAYNKVLFDEWVLVKVAKEEGAILSYEGPRRDGYQKRFKTDIAPLRVEMDGRNMAVGDFEFAPHAPGSFFDAGMRLGPAAYLFCNNTAKSMT